MTQREAVLARVEELYGAICCLGIGDMDGEHRGRAMQHLGQCREAIVRGFNTREAERRSDEDARIIKAYRAGLLVEAGK